jgi:ornithine cyclodeaminase
MPVLLSEDDVRAVLSMDDLIDAMEAALRQYSAGRVNSEPAFFGVMPASMEELAIVGTKLVSVYPSNSARGLPTHLATILLTDYQSGELLAILDGRYITEARTGAASAVSVRHLARANAKTLAVIGAGVQAHSHIEALTRVRRFEEIRIWSRTEARVRSLMEATGSGVHADMRACATVENAVSGADVIALVSGAREPILRREWVSDGAHICAVGACRPDQREMDTALVRDGRLFVDSRTGALAEAGDIVIPIEEGAFDASHIAGELGELGRVPGRRDAAEITIFKSLGMAVEDVAAARLAWERASERGLGRGFVL